MHALISYFKHVRDEFAHITWPSQRKALSHLLVVIIIAATIALFVGLVDSALQGVITRVLGV